MADRKVYVITGPAGSGKTTVANYLCDHHGFHKVVTHTTRAPRPGEVNGKDYYFETPESMKQLHLLERVEYDHHWYGSSMEGLATGWDADKDDVIVLDTKGAVTYRKALGKRAVIIFMTVPKPNLLAHRIKQRGDNHEAVSARLTSAEFHRDMHVPPALAGVAHVVVNDEWEQTEAQVDKIVQGES